MLGILLYGIKAVKLQKPWARLKKIVKYNMCREKIGSNVTHLVVGYTKKWYQRKGYITWDVWAKNQAGLEEIIGFLLMFWHNSSRIEIGENVSILKMGKMWCGIHMSVHIGRGMWVDKWWEKCHHEVHFIMKIPC